MTSQFKRAADSITLNIAEGSIGQSDKEQRRFLGYSIRSVAESVSCLYLSIRRHYITQAEFDFLYSQAETIMGKTITFRKGIGKYT